MTYELKSIATDGYPKEEGEYHCIFEYGTPYESVATVQYDKEYGFHEEFMDCSSITHWFKRIENPTTNKLI